MVRLGLVFVGTSTALAAVDLAHKAGSDTEYFHTRSPAYARVVSGLPGSVGILLSIALSGGVLLGGGAGNLLSLAFWQGVPSPIEVSPIAFNLADVFVLAGFGLGAASTVSSRLGIRTGSTSLSGCASPSRAAPIAKNPAATPKPATAADGSRSRPKPWPTGGRATR